MNILYLHGLDSKLSIQKREILERYGQVLAPDLNYYENPDTISTVLKLFPPEKIHAVIGSSMGGFAGYFVSNALKKPALLFNPALKKRSVSQTIPSGSENYSRYIQMVIGQLDEVIKPGDTMEFLSNNFNQVTDLQIHLVPQLTHNIPPKLFEQEVDFFFRKIEQS